MSAGWIEICWSSGFVGPVDYTKSVLWVDFRWVDYNAGGLSGSAGGLRLLGRWIEAMSARWIENVGPVDRGVLASGLRLLGQWIEECWAGGL